MPRDRGVGQYLPEEVATHARVRYESHDALERNDYLFGGLLSSGTLIQDLPVDAVSDLLLRNEAGNDVYYNVKPTIITTGRSTVQKFVNVDVIDAGDPVPVAQQRSDFPDNTGNIDVTINADVDLTNAREFPERLASTAAEGGQGGGSVVFSESVLIAPGDNLAIELTNTNNQAIDSTIYLRISPIPVNLIDTLTDGPQA